MKNDSIDTSKNDGASPLTADALSTAEPVSRPRDPVTGVFVSKHPRDPELDVEIERYGRDLDADYPHATRALREAAKRAHAMVLRLSRLIESGGALRPSGRVPAAVREAGAWTDRLVRALESLEQTNVKRKGKVDPVRAMADLHALIASRRA